MKKLHWIKGNHLELAFPLTIVNFSESGKTSSNYDVSSAGFSVEVILQGMFSRKKFEPKVVNGNVLRIVDEGTLDVDTYSVEIVVKEPNGTDVDTLRRSKWNRVLQVHDSNEKVVEQFDDFPDYAEGAVVEGNIFFFVGIVGSRGGGSNAPLPMPDMEGYAKVEDIQRLEQEKAGVFYFDKQNKKYLVFANEDSKEAYLADTNRDDLLIGIIDAGTSSEDSHTAIINLESAMYNTIALGAVGNYIDFSFLINNKSGMPTGEPVVCTYTFRKGSTRQTVTEQYAAGKGVHFNIDKYLSEGTNQITISIQGLTSMATTSVGVTYQVVELSLQCNYDIAQVFNLSSESKTLAAEFSISGYGTKTLEWYLDGEKLPFDSITDEVVNESATRTKYIELANLQEGIHNLQVRAYTTVDGEMFYSDTEYREVIVYNGVSNLPVVAIAMSVPSQYGIISSKRLYSMQQYVSYDLNFATYNPKVSTTEVTVKLGDVVQGSVVSENGVANTMTIFPTAIGSTDINFVIGETSHVLGTEIAQSSIKISEITNALQLDFKAQGKSNNATDKDSWQYGEYKGTFTGFNWNNTSGWVGNALHINAGAEFSVDLAPLSGNPSTLGKTIEIEFASTNVNDDNAVLLDLRDADGAGILITASNVKLTSRAGVEIETSYKDNEFIRVAFVINKTSGVTNKCMSFIYVNGVVSRGCAWVASDRYTSEALLKFTGTSDAEMLLKSLRIYDMALTNDQVLNNFNLYRDTVAEMIEVYERNDVYVENSSTFDYEKMAGRLPVMIVTGDIPTLESASDKDTQITVDIEYYNLQDQSRSFTMKNAAMRPQGTSSMGYPKKNFRIYTEKRDDTVLYDASGFPVASKKYAFKKGAQPVNCWCLKADYAESSGAHNTGIARLWNKVLVDAKIDDEYPLRTNAQKAALAAAYQYDVRTTIDGFPILMFYRLTENSPLVFIGKYNFNNDKSTESVFGFCDIPNFDNSKMQCWEVLNNGNALALFTSIANFNSDWSEAFESRYPDTKTPNTEDLRLFCNWMTKVTAANFAVQKWAHLDVYKVAAYYIYLMRFGAVDQTVKNSMLTSEDGEHFYFINYDNDTINGLINTGHLVAPWNTVRTTLGADGEPYYAGKDSRLWNLLEADEEFMTIVRKVDEALYVAGLRYDEVIKMFDEEQAGKWVEKVYNQDAQYKYISPYTEKGVNNLFMLQGNRSQHRKYWLARRFAYFDSLFVSGAYKAHAIELKCIDNTPAGQKFTITAGTDMDYAYGINNIARVSNIALNEDDTYTFTTEETVNRGDPIRIYAAPNIKGLDLSAMTDRLAVVTLDNVYDTSLGTKFKELILGNSVKENTAVESISGLTRAEKLEYLDVRNMKGLTSLDLTNQKNITYVDATGSNIANIEFAKGASLQTLKLSTAMQTMKLEQLPYLKNLSSENNFMTLRTIIIKNCQHLQTNFQMIYDWRMNTQLGAENLELEMAGIQWKDVNPDALISLGALGSLNLKGKIYTTAATQEQIDALTSIFGVECFDKGNDLQIVVPEGLFIGGANEVRGSETIDLTAVIFAENPGSVTWSIQSGSGASIKSSEGLSCVISVTESTSDREIVVQAKHVPSGAGEVTYATKTIKVLKVIRATGGSITGPSTIGSSGEFTFTATPTTINTPYSVTWSLTGDAATAGHVSIKSQNNESCKVQVTSKVMNSTFNVVATLNNGKTSYTITKSNILIGVKFTLHILSNQVDDEATFANVKATVEYGSSSTTMTNGQELNVSANTEIKVTFPSVINYKTPDPIEFVIGDEDEERTGTYLAEKVEVTLSAYDGGDVSGATVRINGVNYTWGGTTIVTKIPFGTEYTIEYQYSPGFIPPKLSTYTASQITRSVQALYEPVPDNAIIIDQTITDPATMISGNVNSSVIQAIRAGSHRYVSKYTAQRELTLCQLDDNNSTLYADGGDASGNIKNYNVFMKMPTFWYRSVELVTDVWMIQFHLGAEQPMGENWIKWDTNALIGVYLISQYNYGPYASVSGRSSVGYFLDVKHENYIAREKGYQLVDWQMHCVMAILYYAQYGHTNCQAKIGAGITQIRRTCGQTDSIGMADTRGTDPIIGLNDAGADGNAQSINFWGLENWWGDLQEKIDNMTYSLDTTVFTITDPNGAERTIKNMFPSSFDVGIRKILIGPYCDVIMTASTSVSVGYCDMYDRTTSSSNSSTCSVLRSGDASGSHGGVAYYNVCNLSKDYVGSRLAFRGNCVIVESSEEFKALTSIS